MKLKKNHPALKEKRTIHKSRVVNVKETSSLLKPVNSNTKVGKGNNIIKVGKFAGFPMVSLSLEERRTCPKCETYESCYGNGTPFAHRINHKDKDFLPTLKRELDSFQYPFMVRLHILGDFYSTKYVKFWGDNLESNKNLNIFGYTARLPKSINGIGWAIRILRNRFPSRFMMRFSTSKILLPTDLIASQEGTREGILCPEQSGACNSCLDCGLCFYVNTPVVFRDHDLLAKERKAKKLKEMAL